MVIQQTSLIDILVRKGHLSKERAEQLQRRKQIQERTLPRLLLEEKIVCEDEIVFLLGQALQIPIVNLERSSNFSSEALLRVSADLCKRYELFPLRFHPKNNQLEVAMSDPTDEEALLVLQRTSGCQIRPYVAKLSSIDETLQLYFFGGGSVPSHSTRTTAQYPKISEETNVCSRPSSVQGKAMFSESPLVQALSEGEKWTGRRTISAVQPFQFQTQEPLVRSSYDGSMPSGLQELIQEQQRFAETMQERIDLEVQSMRSMVLALETRFNEELECLRLGQKRRSRDQRKLWKKLFSLLISRGILERNDIVELLEEVVEETQESPTSKLQRS